MKFVYAIICIIVYPHIDCSTTNGWAERLRFDLLKNYDAFTEPTPLNDTVLYIKVGFTILGIQVDYIKSSFYVNGWIRMGWNDPRIRWDPTKYNDMKTIHFAYHEIWKPQIIALNRIDTHNIDSNLHMNALVDHTGEVLLIPVTNYKIHCDLNYYDWPFDEQTCELIIKLSGTYKTPLQFNNSYNIDWYGSFSNWKILAIDSERATARSCRLCDGPVSKMFYKLRVRKTEQTYYGFVLLPAIVSGILLLSTFWFPITTMKKFFLITMIIITSLILLVFLSRKVPVFHHQLPKIMQFYSWLVVLSTIYLTISLLLYNTMNSQDLLVTPLSQRIRTFFDHPLLHSLYIVPDSEFIKFQLEKMQPHEMDGNYLKYQWLQLTTTLNRIIFLIYTLILLSLMLIYFI